VSDEKPEQRPKVRIFESDHDSLERKETFWSLWQRARDAIGKRKATYVWGERIAGAVTALCAWLSSASASEIGSHTRDFLGSTFGFAGAILGIVIAAFTIFVTISQSDLAIALVVRRPDRKDVEVRTIALHFIAAFAPYVAFCALYGIVAAVAWPGGFVTLAVTAFDHLIPGAAKVLASLSLGLVSWAFARLLVTLSALITNVYRTFMLLVGARIAESDRVEFVQDGSDKSDAPTTDTTEDRAGTEKPAQPRRKVRVKESASTERTRRDDKARHAREAEQAEAEAEEEDNERAGHRRRGSKRHR